PAAIDAAAPPLDPPAVRAKFQGFEVTPVSSLSVTPSIPNSGVVVLPKTSAPASLSRPTLMASFSGTYVAKSLLPKVVRIPAVGARSLTLSGTPNRRGRSDAEPLITA